ncbi:MAG: hypothetical protein V4456_03355 [Bacteroidota bacterium]
MDEQFDKKLTNHIREVFDNYEHPGVEHGWEQLRKKFPAEQKNNKVAWLWWSSAAAIIIVFLGIGIWYNSKPNAVNNLAVKPTVKKQQPVIAGPKPTGNNQPNTVTPVTTDQPAVAKNSAPVFNNPVTPAIHYQTPVVNANTLPVNTNVNTGIQAQQQAIANSAVPNSAQNGQPAQVVTLTPAIDSQKNINSIANQPQLAATTQNVQAPVNNNALANSTAKKQPKTMADMFADEKLNQPAKKHNADKQNNKKVNFSIYAATYFNYAEGSANQVNAGAGFTSDFRLSKNIKLSTGVALAQNSLSYNSSPPQSPSASGFVASAPALRQQDALFATSAVLPMFKNYNASLVGLDIPINIKYELNPEKSDAYISAGLSSGTFINESYTYRYVYGNGASSAASSSEEQTTHNSFNNFYFGKTLNFSFGVGYPVGGNRLIVEPFVKYPLGGLGAQDIRFGAGGINLKFSFKTQKK